MIRDYLGALVPANIDRGEVVDGAAAGLHGGYTIRGIGLRPLREVYPAEELTEFAKPGDTCWAAEIIGVPQHTA